MTLPRSDSPVEPSDVVTSRLLANDKIASRGDFTVNESRIADGTAEPVEEVPSPEQPLMEQISELVDNAKVLAETEIAYYRSKLDVNVSSVKKIITLFSIGIAFGTAGLTALVLGALLTLSPIIGPGPATLVVALGFCALAALLIFFARRKAKRLPLDSDML